MIIFSMNLFPVMKCIWGCRAQESISLIPKSYLSPQEIGSRIVPFGTPKTVKRSNSTSLLFPGRPFWAPLFSLLTQTRSFQSLGGLRPLSLAYSLRPNTLYLRKIVQLGSGPNCIILHKSIRYLCVTD